MHGNTITIVNRSILKINSCIKAMNVLIFYQNLVSESLMTLLLLDDLFSKLKFPFIFSHVIHDSIAWKPRFDQFDQ